MKKNNINFIDSLNNLEEWKFSYFEQKNKSFFNLKKVIEAINYAYNPSAGPPNSTYTTPKFDVFDIVYKHNNYGYRDEDFIKNKPADLLTLGCSHTYGFGLPIEKTWPSLLSQDLNVTMHNLGVSGDSAIGQVHHAFWYFENVGVPKKIAALFPLQRMLLMAVPEKNLPFNPSFYSINKTFFENKNFKKYSKAPHIIEETMSPETSILYTFLAISILQSFCKVNNIEFVFYIFENNDIKEFIDKDSNFFNNFCNLDLIFFKSKDCHKEYQDDILFDSAADRKNNNPHFGLHRHLHISEGFAKYFKDIKKEKHL